jgi:hypothetical protein
MNLARFALILAAAASPLAAQSAPRVGTTLPAAEQTELMTVRKAVWVNWFSGDTAALRKVLTPELIAISPDVPRWQSLSETIYASAGFKADGGKFISVAFDSDVVHRFGEVVVMFSLYTVVMEHSGKRTTQRGRATEVFVRQNGRWLHTSWHLDVIA